MGKGNTKGRYLTKIGFYDIYGKNTMRKSKSGKDEVASTDYIIYHSKKLIQRGFKSKELAVIEAQKLFNNYEKTSSSTKK